MSVIHPSIYTIMERFPEYRDAIRHLYSSSKDFQTLCQDYQQCSDALRYWKTSQDEKAPERQQEYMTLADEMEIDILLYCTCNSDTDYEIWAFE